MPLRLKDYIDRFAEAMQQRGWFSGTGNTGSGVPPGGIKDQVLTKLSNTDGDADWENLTNLGGPLLIDGGNASTAIPSYVFRFDLGASV